MNQVRLHEGIRQELSEVPSGVYRRLFDILGALQTKGTSLASPYAEPLHVPQGTQPLMNLRFSAARGVWRVPYCLVASGTGEYFLLLAIGNKEGLDPKTGQSRRFYEELIDRAQQRLGDDTVVWPEHKQGVVMKGTCRNSISLADWIAGFPEDEQQAMRAGHRPV